MTTIDINNIQAGLFLMIALYFVVNYFSLKHKKYLFLVVYAVSLFLYSYFISLSNMIQVILISIAYISYITLLKKNTKDILLFVQILIAIYATMLSFQLYQLTMVTNIIKSTIVFLLGFYLLKSIKTEKKIKSLHLSVVFCIAGIIYYNPTLSLVQSNIFKAILIAQIFFILDTLITEYYLYNQEKENINDRLFLQMQENYLYHLKIRQLKEDIKSNLHDDIGSQLSLINSLNQLALQYIDIDKEKTAEYLKEIHRKLIEIPTKLENIIEDNFLAETHQVNNQIIFEQIAATLFDSNNIQYRGSLHISGKCSMKTI